MKVYIVTHIDLANNGYTPKDVFPFTKREDAVAKMKELYEQDTKAQGIEDPYAEDSADFYFADAPFNAPFIPYAFCPDYYIDFFETDLK